MAIRNVDDLYNELSSNENFSGLFSSPEDLASSLQSMSPERRDSFFEKMGASEQVSKVDFDNVLKKKDVSLSNLQLDGGDQGNEEITPQPKPAIPSPIKPPRITLFPDEPAPGSPLKRKTIEERFPQTPEEKKKQQQAAGIQAVMQEQKKNKDIYVPKKTPTLEQTKQSIALQQEFERQQQIVSDMPIIQKVDWEAVARGEEFKKKTDEAAAQKKAAEVKGAKESTNSLFSGLQQGIYDYTIADGRKFQLDEYAIGRALFENEPIEVFSKTGNKVDILDPNRGILTGGEGNFNVIDDKSIRDHFTRLGLDETQTDEEILRLKQVYLQEGAKSASKSFYDQLLTKWNGNKALANQNYLAYWNNRGLDLLEGAEKEAYHIVRQMEGLRSQLIKEQKKGGLSNYSSANIASFRKQLDDYQDQLSELRDNPNNLYDWRTGEFIDARIRKSDPRVAEIQQENKEFQAKYGDKPKEVLVKRRDELLAQRAFIMGKMKQFNLDIPEEGTWDAAVRALQISAARTAGTNQIVLPDGRSVSSIDYKRKMDDYNSQLYSVMSELYGLNRSVMLNENVALRKESESFLGSIAKNIGIATESVVREFAPGASTQDANSEFNRRNSVLNALEQSGYVVSPSLRSDASASVSETISGSAGMLVSSMLQIAVGNIAVPEVMALRWAKGFKDLLTNKYGKIGGAVFEQTANAMRSGLIFQAAGQGFSTGVGEAGAQAAFDALDLDKLLGSKGRLANFLYRSLIGGAGEFTEEVAGQYIQGLTDAGFDPNKAFKESFGISPESRLDQLLVIGITSLGFSGASNLKILTASQSTLNQILEDPKLAAAYGDVLTPEKRQQIEEVLKAVDDKLADKQSRQTNASVTAAESSEYTPRVDAAESEKQVSIFNEERKKALEQLAVEDGPQSEEQKAELEQKATEINNYYDEQIRSVVPPQTKFDTFTGTNQNAVLGNSDLNSEQTQNFLASLPNERARRNAATLIAVGNNSNNTLSSVLPNAKIVMHSRESFRDKMSQLGEEANRKGNFAVIRNKDGSNQIEIQINVEDGAVIDIAHEVTHGVLYSKFYGDDKRMAEVAVINANKELSEEDKQAQIEQVNQTYDSKFSETLGEFKNQLEALVNEKGNTYLKDFISNYEDNAKNEEYLTELIAILVKNGEQIEQEDPTFFVRLLALLNKLVGVIGKEAGIKLQKFDDTQEVIDFFNTIASSIRKGEALTETNLTKKDAVQEQTAGQVPVQSEASVGQEVGQGKPESKTQVPTEEGKKEVASKPRVSPLMKQVFHGGDLQSPGNNLYVATDRRQADAYAQGNQGKVFKFFVDKNSLAPEDLVRQTIVDLGLQPREEGWKQDELGIHELLDNRFDTSLPDEQIAQLQDKLKSEGYTGVAFIDEDILQKNKAGVENYLIFNPKDLYKSEQEGINKLTPEQPNVVSKARRDSEAVRKDLDKKLASGAIDDVTLSLLEEYAEQIEGGTAVFERFSSSEHTGIIRGSRALAEAVLLVGRNVEADETQDERNERQEQEVEEYARERGIWVDNTLKTFNGLYGERLGSGQEAIVWRKDDNTVIKSSNTLQYEDLQLFLDRLVLHNTLFPASAQKLVGFGSDSNGDFEVIIEQPYIPESEEATTQEIKEYLAKLGFEQYLGFGGGERFKTNEVLLNDAAPRNFVKTENGKIIPIDLILKINLAQYGFGGTRVLAGTQISTEAIQENTDKIIDVRSKARKIDFDKNTGDISVNDKKVDVPTEVANSSNSIPNALDFASASSIPTNLEFKRALQDRFQSYLPELKKKYGENFDPQKENDALKSYLVDAYTYETMIAMKSFPDALGWYDAKTKAAMEVMSLVHPEIATDPIAAGIFKIAVAVTSNGNKVTDNFIEADRQYNYFKDNGKFDETKSIGTQSSGIKSTFNLTNEILKTLTKEQFIKFLTSKFRAGDLKYTTKSGKSTPLLTGFTVNTQVFGASIFGPKIGNGFFMNLYGDFTQLTMDRWFMRQFGRLTGTLIKVDPKKVKEGTDRLKSSLKSLGAKEKAILNDLIPNYASLAPDKLAEKIVKVSSKVAKREILQDNTKLDEVRKAGNSLDKNIKGEIEAPGGGKQRAFIIGVFDEVQKRLKDEFDLDITIADLQAVNWYPEKALYQTFQAGKTEELGAEETSDNEQPDYESAAKKLAKNYGFNEKQINDKLNNEDGTRKFDTGGNQEFGRNHSDIGVELAKKQILEVKTNLEKNKVKSKARLEAWSTPQQEISSAGTSINKAKLPSVYSDKKFLDLLKGVPGKRIVIADIGSGKYANVNIKPLLEKGEIAEFINDSSKKMLGEKAVPALEEVLGGKEIAYHPYDPFNQPAEVNEETISTVRDGGADIAVSPNVLNVIAEAEAREGVIFNMANAVGTTGTAVIQIYEGDPKDRGVGKETKTAGEVSWQNNQQTVWYLPEVQAYFANVKRSGNIIIADNKGQMSLFGQPAVVNGAQKAQIQSKARIEDRVKQSKGYGVPQRYKGDVGKMIGGDLYVHSSANDVLPQKELIAAEAKLPEDFEYEVIKYNAADGSFSFIASPDWNTSNEPIVGDAYKVKSSGEVTITKQKADPQIYHHKWNFVRDDYSGFNVEQSVQRSIDWYRDAKADINMFKIGTQSYWKENATPLITDTTKIISKARVDRVDYAIVKDYNDFRNAGFSVDGAYYELEKMNYSPGDIKRYIPEIGENWKKRSVNKFFATIRKHRGKITKRQGQIRQELENNPGLEFDSLYTLLKDKFEDFELYKAFYEEGANPALLDEIFGTEYRQTIQKAMDETRSGRTVYNRDFLREIKDDARSRKMVNLANQMNSLFGFTNGIIDNQQMIEMMADGLEETGLEFSLRAVTDDIRTKRAELEADLNVLKKIGRAQVDPKDMINVSRLLSLAGRMLRMGRGLFKNQELFEKAIFDSIENVSYKTEAGNIIRKFKGFKLTNGQKEKIRKAITEFRTAKAEYETEIKALEESENAYTDSQYEAFDKSKIKFDQAARKLKTTIDAFKKKSTGNWFTSMTALALLSFRTIFIGAIGNLELMLANTPKKGKFLVLGWSRALANKLVTAFTRRSVTELNSMIKRGASGNIDPELYRKMAWEQGVQQIKNIFENTVASASNSENAFFEGQNTIDSTRELPTGIKMIGVLMKNIFKKDFDKVSDQEWAEQFDQLLVLLNEKDENGNNKLELMNPKGYQATTTLLRGIFGYIPSAVGKSIALSGDRVFYQYGYYEALASYAYAQGITDPAEVKKFIRLNSVPNATAGEVARKEGERRIFANDNVITDAFTKARGNIAKTEKNLYAKSVKLKKEGKYLQRFIEIYPAKLGLATTKMAMTVLSPFTRIPSNFVGTAVEKTVAPYTIVSYWFAQRKLNRLVREYDNLFNIDENETLSATKQKEQERLRNAIFEQQRVAGRKLVSTFQALQVAAVAYLLWQSGAVGAPYGDDEEEKKAARAAGLAGQPPGKINVTALIDYMTNGFDKKGRTYQPGDFTFSYTNLGIFGFGMTWFATMHGSLAAKEFEDRKVMGVGEDGYSNVSFNMVAESITNGITGLSFIQNVSALVAAVKTKEEGLQNFAVNLAKTALTVPSMAYGIFGAVEKAEGISADSMRNYFPDLEADDSIGSKFKLKLWTSMTGKSPISLFGLRNTKGEFLSPYASPYYQPQIGPHGEELYKKNTFWDVRSGELSDRVAAYLQASFDPFSMSTYEGFVSTVKKYNAKQTYNPGDIVDLGDYVIAVKKQIPPGANLSKLNLDQQDKDYETITESKDFFDKDKFLLNKRGSEATTQLYDLLALYQKSTGSRKEFSLLSKYYAPFVEGKDDEGKFGVYIPLKYQRELAKLRGDQILNSYDQNQIKEAIDRIQKNADDMSDEEFNKYTENEIEDLLMGPINAVTLARSGGIASKMNDALAQLESNETYRVVKTKAIHEALAAGLFTEEQYLRMANAEGTNEIVAEFDKSKLKFKK